jgi:hypothetical protein
VDAEIDGLAGIEGGSPDVNELVLRTRRPAGFAEYDAALARAL